MKIESEKLLLDLIERTRLVLNEVETFKGKSEQELLYKPNSETWNMLECIEHLNYYGDFYLPEIAHRIDSGTSPSELTFRAGLLGDYFAKSMLPKEKLNKMKTFKVMDPIHTSPDISVLDKFTKQQETLLDLLDASREVSLTRTKTSISISKWIKLRLGDTFRVLIYHNQRHLVQAQSVSKEYIGSK